MPLDGTDAQCLEHALTITERERDEALDRAKLAENLANLFAAAEQWPAWKARAEKAEADLAKLRPVYEAAVQCKNDCKVSFDPNVHPCRSCGGLRACAAVEAWKEGK
jgi:hypothetical protein